MLMFVFLAFARTTDKNEFLYKIGRLNYLISRRLYSSCPVLMCHTASDEEWMPCINPVSMFQTLLANF